MIFKTLSLENFRVFNGVHHIELAPRREGVISRPVVLFGGLNGAGKTSILSAIRLALLGRKSIGNAVSKKDFNEYLTQQINQKAVKDTTDPVAKVSLEFTHTHQGEHSTYRVVRDWSLEADESLILFKNDVHEESLTTDQTTAFTGSTTKIDTRARGRQATVRFESDDDGDTGARLGVGFRIGGTRLDVQPNGRR